MENMITVTGISSSYGKRQILKGASFTAGKGECIGIVGANGCGKSTFLSILAGVLKPDAGTVLYGGRAAWRRSAVGGRGNRSGRMRCDRELIRRMTGYVPQENPLMPELSVYDNLRLWYPDKEELLHELKDGFLGVLGIGKFVTERAGKLSGGMKKRVSIGIAMAGMPPVLLMDEPGAALDLVCKEDIRKYLQLYLARHGTVVIATHEEGELSLCDKLYVMKNGVLSQIDRNLRGEALTGLF